MIHVFYTVYVWKQASWANTPRINEGCAQVDVCIFYKQISKEDIRQKKRQLSPDKSVGLWCSYMNWCSSPAGEAKGESLCVCVCDDDTTKRCETARRRTWARRLGEVRHVSRHFSLSASVFVYPRPTSHPVSACESFLWRRTASWARSFSYPAD